MSPFFTSWGLPGSCLLAQEWKHYCGDEALGILHCLLPGEGLGGKLYTLICWGNRLLWEPEVGILFHTLGIAVIEIVGQYIASNNGYLALRVHTEFWEPGRRYTLIKALGRMMSSSEFPRSMKASSAGPHA